jgi:hypothetical protein
MTALYNAYIEYLAALCVRRCGLGPHSHEIAGYFDKTLTNRHFSSADKEQEFERQGWSLVETFTLVDEHKIDPFLKNILSIMEIQNLLEQTDNGIQLITVTRSCQSPYAQTWSLTLKPNINLFSSDAFIVSLKLTLKLRSPTSPVQITSIEHNEFDHELFVQKMEPYKLFHSKSM